MISQFMISNGFMYFQFLRLASHMDTDSSDTASKSKIISIAGAELTLQLI